MAGVRWFVESVIALAKVFLLVLFALFLPRLFLCDGAVVNCKMVKTSSPPFKLGLENISQEFLQQLGRNTVTSCRVGLITNHTGVDQNGRRNIDTLVEKGLKVSCIFAPKHGYHADGCEGNLLADIKDVKTDIPIVNFSGKLASKQLDSYIKKVDVVMFDMQDSGMRQGYVSTLLDAMQLAAHHHKPFVVLDRPNPLGSCMEGMPSSITSIGDIPLPIPLRHGMTTAELASYFNAKVLKTAIQLYVVPMENYKRAEAPLECRISPNIKTAAACFGYSFLGLLGEVAPFDVGIGTNYAFQTVALPNSLNFSRQKWYELRSIVKKFGIESKLCSYYSERKKDYCTGLQLFVSDMNSVSSCKTLLAILNFFKDEKVSLAFSANFDRALGTPKFRQLLQGTTDYQTFSKELDSALHAFYAKARDSFIYKPLPKVVTV